MLHKDLPRPTREIEQGKRDLDAFGYCIHRDLLSTDQITALLDRLDEQARLEREEAVAWLGNGGRGGSTWMGAPRVVPGSHLGPSPKLKIDFKKMDGFNRDRIESIPAECEAGSAIVFQGRLWHSSGAHRSERTRYSISNYDALPFIRPQDNYTASMHDDVYLSISDVERAMFGFKTGPLGRIDPRFPGDRTNVDMKGPYIPELRAGSDKHAVPAS